MFVLCEREDRRAWRFALLLTETSGMTDVREFAFYLNGNVTVGAPDDPRDGQRDLVLDGPGPVRADEAWVLHLGERGPHEIQRLLQSVSVLRAGVQDVSSELNPGKDAIAGVDLIERQEHGFQPLDPPFLIDHSAVLGPLAFVVHREQTPDHQVPVQDNLVFGCWWQPGAARQDSEYQQLQKEQVEWPVMSGVGRRVGGASEDQHGRTGEQRSAGTRKDEQRFRGRGDGRFSGLPSTGAAFPRFPA